MPLPAPRLWDSMWRPEVLAQWWGPGAEVVLRRYGDAALTPLPTDDGRAWTGSVKMLREDDPETRVVVIERSGRPDQRVTLQLRRCDAGRSRLRIVADGVSDPDEVVRFLQHRLNRLARWASAVRAREGAPTQAVIVIHGIGEQQPGETLKAFVDGLFPPTEKPPVVRRYKPDLLDDTFELRRVSIDRDSPGHPDYPRTDIYELYWAHLMSGSALSDVTSWSLRLLRRSPRRVPAALRPWWYLVWALVALSVGLVVAGLLGGAALLPAWGLAVATAIGAIWAAVKAPVLGGIVGFVGDAARYLSPEPNNIARRQEIRGAGVRLLERLHESGRYDRIVVFGHSLGSVVAYDIVSIAWIRMHRRHASPRTTESSRLRTLQGALAGSTPPDPMTFAGLQHDAWKESRANTQPWLVTDLVTAGSPLAHAELLLTTRKDPDIGPLIAERVLPADPPVGERVEGQRRISWNLPYTDAVSRHGHKILIPDHAAPFALTRWTNLFFSTRGLRGDPVGGVIPASLGSSVRNIELPVPPTGGFAHSRYWERLRPKDRQRDPDAPEHVAALAEALGLPAASSLRAVNTTLPAHLLAADPS